MFAAFSSLLFFLHHVNRFFCSLFFLSRTFFFIIPLYLSYSIQIFVFLHIQIVERSGNVCCSSLICIIKYAFEREKKQKNLYRARKFVFYSYIFARVHIDRNGCDAHSKYIYLFRRILHTY